MSKLMIGTAVVGLGMYAASLGGEWTEAELKEKRMVSSAVLALSRAILSGTRILLPVDVRDSPFDEVGTDSGESH
jgi:hypothetical protein